MKLKKDGKILDVNQSNLEESNRPSFNSCNIIDQSNFGQNIIEDTILDTVLDESCHD